MRAHDVGQSESELVVGGSQVRARVTLDLLEVAGVDLNGDDRISYGELDDGIERIFALLRNYLEITDAERSARITLERYTVKDDHVAQLELLLAFERPVTSLTIASRLHQVLRPNHEHLAIVAFDRSPPRQALLTAGSPTVSFAQEPNPFAPAILLGLAAGIVGGGVVLARLARRVLRR